MLGARVAWGDAWTPLQPVLEQAKRIASDRRVAQITGGDIFSFGDSEARMWCCAAGNEGHDGVPRFRYGFSCDGFSVRIANRRHPGPDAANIYIGASGAPCLERGGLGCLTYMRELIRRAGGTILSESLSRVDMCLDLPGVAIDELFAAFNERRYISWGRTRHFDESNGITFRIGSGAIQLRVYDKRAELMAKGNAKGIVDMTVRRWNGKIPLAAMRVEFQLRREALTGHGIDTPDDYFAKRSDLVAFLCKEWVRFTAGAVNRQNTGREKILPLWLDVTAGFALWAGAPRGESLAPLPRGSPNVDHLLKQGVGALLKAAVVCGLRIDTRAALVAYVANLPAWCTDTYLQATSARKAVSPEV